VTPRVPRGLSGRRFIQLCEKLGYAYARSNSSHVVLTTQRDGEFSICVPDHKELSIGTMSDLLLDMSRHHGMSKSELMNLLFS
jgi:predicted RNA binding protein YcfA (HicA-like mRNA interferase family)